MRRFIILVLALALVTAACNRGDDADLTTTTTGGSPTTSTSAGASTDDGTDDETTTTAAGAVQPPTYDIIAGVTGSDEYVVLVEPGAYAEQDLRNIMEDVVDEHAPVTAHLIDSEEAGHLVLKDELSDSEQELLDAHYLARIVEGTTLEFLGPYSNLESVHIGS